jgi:ATP-binding cassette subfamily F protein 3
MCRSDLLLLDEPTNHLDLDAVLWLEQWLRAYPGTLLLISHDRDFLDRVSGHVLHLESPGARLYTGGYSDFERQRAERLAGEQAHAERCRREAERIHRFVERFRAKATKARQVQSRLKALARLEAASAAHADDPVRLSFLAPERQPAKLLELRGVAAGYGDGRPVLSGVRLHLRGEDRIGLLGANGAGKSTLVKLLVGALEPLEGEVEHAPGLRIGYFAQHSLEQLREAESPLAHCQACAPDWGEQALRDFLGGLGFRDDAALAPVAPLSGGERARLVLAMLVLQRPHLLLLDEPTNHLDLDTRHALTVALQEYPGAMVLVSHDRHLLRSVTDGLLLVEGGHVAPFEGDVDDYVRLREGRGTPEAPGAAGEQGERRRDARRREAEARQRLQPLRRRLRTLEADMERLSGEKAELEARLADPALYGEARKAELLALMEAQRDVARRLEAAEEAWLEAGEALESAAGER